MATLFRTCAEENSVPLREGKVLGKKCEGEPDFMIALYKNVFGVTAYLKFHY